jgi:hypothetical protein
VREERRLTTLFSHNGSTAGWLISSHKVNGLNICSSVYWHFQKNVEYEAPAARPISKERK